MKKKKSKIDGMQPEKADKGPLQYSIWIYPWDVLDAGAETVVGELVDCGFSALSVATTYHAGRLLLPHNPRRTVYFLEDGVAYFEPHPNYYERTALKPMRASLASEGDPLRPIIRAAQARNFRVHGWTVFFHNSRLGELHRDMTIENVYGERYTYALCPSHPHARAYALALATDLADHYELAALELEAIGFMGHGHLSHHDKAGICLDLLHDFLLSLCFCCYCKDRIQALEADPELIKTKLRKELETYFKGEGKPAVNDPETIEARLVETLGRTSLNSLLLARDQTVSSLVSEIRQSVRREVQLIMRAASSRFVTGGDAGIEWQSLATVIDRFLLIQFFREIRLAGKELRRASEYRDRCGVPLHVGLRAYYPDITNERELRARLQLLNECKVEGVQFYNYGLLPPANLEWIRRSIRA
ncbi:MAG: hypothetical protein LAN62_17275 [Acidobacteriia bacterium]|nr:hypothetical protein [Terriglobia bacterium]